MWKTVRAILLRLLYGGLSLLFITFVAFLADEAAPGDYATVRAGEKASQADIERLRKQYGLDRPWPIRYAEMLGRLAQGDLGESYLPTQGKVKDVLARNVPMTLRLAIFAIVLAAAVGITLGTLAAIYENRFVDRTVLIGSTLGVTIPNFVLAPLLVWFFYFFLPSKTGGNPIFAQNWDPVTSKPDFYTLALPIMILAARPAAMLTRLTRASMIETLQQEFIRLATAKGVPPMRLILRHALRNAILPVITAIGTSFGFLLTGSFVVERFFSLPGIGKEAIEAIIASDAPVVMGTIIFSGFLFITVNLVVDILLPILDPRIREAQI
jgi:peptide/nickel transport system permease protein